MANPDKLAAAASAATAQPEGAEASTQTAVQATVVDVAAPKNAEEAAQVIADNSAAAEAVIQAAATAPVEPAPIAVAVATTVKETTVKETSAPIVEQDTAVQSAKGSPSANALMAQWLQYAIDCDSRKILTKFQLTRQQKNMVRMINSTVNLDETQDFVQVSNYLISLVHENKTGAFSSGALFRLFDTGIESQVVTNQTRFCLDAFLCFADPKHRAANVNVYNLINSAQLAKTSAKRDRFVAYFRRISGIR